MTKIRRNQSRSARPAGFSLVELLVVLSVTSLLLALLMPSFARIRETARQVVCSTNLHQIGVALSSYVDDDTRGRGFLPGSEYAKYTNPRLQEMMTLHRGETLESWDGLGWLVNAGAVTSPQTFYCPSHQGDNEFQRYADDWAHVNWRIPNRILGNYHYRGVTPSNQPIDAVQFDILAKVVAQWTTERVCIITDGLRTKSDFNHIVGTNSLALDLSVAWISDNGMRIYNLLPERATGQHGTVRDAWSELDRWFR